MNLDKNMYVGEWIELSALGRDVEVGDLVMLETLDDTLVVMVSTIKGGSLWHFNGWIIPDEQIVAIKRAESQGSEED